VTPVLIFKDTGNEMENKGTEGINKLIHIFLLMFYYFFGQLIFLCMLRFLQVFLHVYVKVLILVLLYGELYKHWPMIFYFFVLCKITPILIGNKTIKGGGRDCHDSIIWD
jgi:hypothetical protein